MAVFDISQTGQMDEILILSASIARAAILKLNSQLLHLDGVVAGLYIALHK